MGLLDYLSTPQGQGLLSGVASYAMNARRGTPVNNLGRGLAGGITGYVNANDQVRQDEENAFQKQYRQLQMDEMQQKLARQKALSEASMSAGKLVGKPTQYAAGGQTFDTPQQARASASNMYALPAGAVPDSLLPAGQPRADGFMGSNPVGAVDFSMGQTPQVTEQKSPDMRAALYAKLMEAGLPDEAMKYAPKWTVGERFNEASGMREKVIYDENNPTDARPFGGSEADTIVADNLGGSMVYRGAHSANPVGEVKRTATPDSILTDARVRREGALNRDVTRRGQDMVDRRSRSTTAASGWKYDAASDEWVAPPTPQYPMGQRSGNKAKMDAGQSMQYVIDQMRGTPAVGDKNSVGYKPAVPGALNEATTGGMMGFSGMAGKVFDSQDAMRFENLKEQMSTELRTLFRIPGEGALSDKEQAQYGIQLPSLKYSKGNNEKILRDIEARIKLRNNQNANPMAPAAPSGGARFLGFEE